MVLDNDIILVTHEHDGELPGRSQSIKLAKQLLLLLLQAHNNVQHLHFFNLLQLQRVLLEVQLHLRFHLQVGVRSVGWLRLVGKVRAI